MSFLTPHFPVRSIHSKSCQRANMSHMSTISLKLFSTPALHYYPESQPLQTHPHQTTHHPSNNQNPQTGILEEIPSKSHAPDLSARYLLLPVLHVGLPTQTSIVVHSSRSKTKSRQTPTRACKLTSHSSTRQKLPSAGTSSSSMKSSSSWQKTTVTPLERHLGSSMTMKANGKKWFSAFLVCGFAAAASRFAVDELIKDATCASRISCTVVPGDKRVAGAGARKVMAGSSPSPSPVR